MLNQPKFKSCFHVEILEPEGVFIRSERDVVLLSDRLTKLLAPLIDGNRTIDAIIDLLEEQASAAEIYYAVMQMKQQGYLVEAHEDIPPAIADLAYTLNVDAKEATRNWQNTKVAVKTFGTVSTEKFISILESLNIQVSKDGDIEVVLADDYLQASLDAFNQKAWQSQRPWMLVKPGGTIIWIGPIFHPGKTGCWQCLAQRLRVNRPVEAFIEKRQGTSTLPASSVLSTVPMGMNLAAIEIMKWIILGGIQGKNQQLEGKLITFDLIHLELKTHTLVQRIQCSCCGELEHWVNREPVPVVLRNQKKTISIDGGYRCFSPEATLEKYEHHISPITGVVWRLKKEFQVDNNLIYSYTASHHFSSIVDDLPALRQNVRGRSAGKGKTDIQARASALCEAIERYSGVFQGDEIRHKATYQEMALAIHPNECMNFSRKQYQNRQEWNAKASINHIIPESFDETRKIDWTPIWSLSHQVFKYLPTAYCYYGYPNSHNLGCFADSNGCAAGNTMEEAILQGFMELVERDSVALWWYNRLKKPGVNLDSFNEPYFQALKDYYQTINREFWVLDLTSDFKIPVFVAISRRTDREIEDIFFGYGAHFNPYIAVLRALTEMNQFLPSMSSINSDGSTRYPSFSQSAVDWRKTATVKKQDYLVPAPNTTVKDCSDYPHLWKDDLVEDITTCLEIVKANKMEMLVLEQTQPDIGLNVVKVIVPGMCHFWRRLGSKRLYDVPVKLGLLEKLNSEEELNPLSIY